MSNKIILKKSSVGAKVPVTGDLDYGELALNYADGKLYFKNSSNQISSFSASAVDLSTYVTLTGSQTLTNKTLTAPSIGNAVLTGTLSAGDSVGTNGQVLTSTGTGIQWAAASGSGSISSGDANLVIIGRSLNITAKLTAYLSMCFNYDDITTRSPLATVITRNNTVYAYGS